MAYKHGIECGNANFMVMTIFCSDPDYNNYNPKSDVFSSRVMLIRKDPRTYRDITSRLEDYNVVRRAAWHGIDAVCVSPGEEV